MRFNLGKKKHKTKCANVDKIEIYVGGQVME